jgi:hypothetical protein
MTFTRNFTGTFTAGLSRQDFHQDFHHVCVRPRSKTKHYMLTWGGLCSTFVELLAGSRESARNFQFLHTDNASSQPNAYPKAHRRRIVTMPQSPQPLQNKAIRACSRCWTKRILVVHSVIKVTKCLSSYVWRWSLAANASCSMWHWSLAANASCSFFFRFSFSSSCSFRFRRLACISHASAGKVSVSESVIVSDGKVSADMDANLKSQTNEGLGSPPDSLSQSSCQQQLDWCLTCA